jgi:5-methylcytosine-specific restriction protein B
MAKLRSAQFKHYQENLKNPQFDALIDTIQALNVDIRDDDIVKPIFF